MEMVSEGSSSFIHGVKTEDFSVMNRDGDGIPREPLDGKERKDRVESPGVMLTDGERGGGPPLVLLAKLATVAVESRLSKLLEDARESLDARRERAAEMNMRVSCSEIGDGPGIGGNGVEGGREGGRLMLGDGVGVTLNGEGGICEGGKGKDERSRGTVPLVALRLSRKRDSGRVSVVVVEDITLAGWNTLWAKEFLLFSRSLKE